MVTWLKQWLCGLSGHESLVQYEPGRLSLKCVNCQHESPGWEIGKHKPSKVVPMVRRDTRRRVA